MFAPYLKGHAGQYVYRMKGEETGTHLQRIGELMQRLLVELKVGYAAEPVYQVLGQVFGEHFQVEQTEVVTKPNEALSAASRRLIVAGAALTLIRCWRYSQASVPVSAAGP